MPPFGNTQLKLLEKLCNVIAISGDEGEVRKIVLEEIKPYVDEVKVDVLGNVLAVRHGRGTKRVSIQHDAHMDEVGFFIVADEGEGIYRFETVGGIDVRHLVGKQVLIGNDRIPGVIGGKPVHLMDDDEAKRKVPLDVLRIDLGLGGKAKVGGGDGLHRCRSHGDSRDCIAGTGLGASGRRESTERFTDVLFCRYTTRSG